MKRNSHGFSLLELMLALVFIVAASAVAYKMFKPSQTQAAVSNEQKRVGNLVDKVIGLYATERSFQNISTASVAGILNLPIQSDGTLSSSLKSGGITIRPGSQFQAGSNDAFEIVYSSTTPEECIGMVKALGPRADAAYVGGPSYNMIENGRVREDLLVTNCDSYAKNGLAFRFGSQKNTYAATQLEAGLCSPETENQQLACPTGNSGSINQRRTSTCVGSPATTQWSSWVTTTNTCGADATPTTPQTPIAPTSACIDAREYRNMACASGQIGSIVQSRTQSCTTNTWGAWVDLQNSCRPGVSVGSCTPGTERKYFACPAGQGGQIYAEFATICDSQGNDISPNKNDQNNWKIISSNCTASCVSSGTCCTVSRGPVESRTTQCAVGSYGPGITTRHQQSSSCPQFDGPAVWNNSGWSQVGNATGGCNTCTPNQTTQSVQWVRRAGICPAGQTGELIYNDEQVQDVAITRLCNSQAGVLNDNATTTASAWRNTGNTVVASNTCTTPPAQQYWWVARDRVYGPGSGCHLGSDQNNADQLVKQGILIGSGQIPYRSYSVSPTQPCGPATDGATIIVYQSCGGFQAGLEGYSGFRCENVNGLNGLVWIYQQDVYGGRELYRGPNPASSGFPLERPFDEPTGTCTAGQTTVTSGGILTAWFGTGANRYAVIQEYGARFVCGENAYPEF